jgi:serine/threonine-protein kinase
MLAQGFRLGSYEVRERIGAGGMGEVFRAHDERLGRDVAIKVLSDQSRLDSQHLARFQREAHVLATLNHPNIATLHAVESLGDAQALILELIEGETLAERIARGALPLPEALAIARQIVAALEAAHEKGVIHRDLKPSNIKLRPDGMVKLLDFGLAKASDPVPARADAVAIGATVDASEALIGTLSFMSPEQVRCLPVDKRGDIWAFGCVLYEMLTGTAAFKGDQVADVMAQIIGKEPDFDALPEVVPPAIRRLLQRCLRKDARERLRDIGDARLDLEEALSAKAPEPAVRRRMSRAGKAGLVALATFAVAAAIVVPWYTRATARPERFSARVSRFSIPADKFYSGLNIAPDGTRFVYVTGRGLVVRSLDNVESAELAAPSLTSNGAPFFSPDGKWIVYSDDEGLLKLPVGGGTPARVVNAGMSVVGGWSAGSIAFANMRGLFRVPAQGGAAEPLVAGLGVGERAVFPQYLANNAAVLFTVVPTRSNSPATSKFPDARIDVLNLESGERRTLLRGASRARYVQSGHLIYTVGQTLYAVAFDAARLELHGDPVQMATGVSGSEFSVSDDGTLVYFTGRDSRGNSLVWVNRQGQEEPLAAPPRGYIFPRLSPDSTRVALDVQGAPRDIWTWDVRRKSLQRFTVGPAGHALVAWSRDGKLLAFGDERSGVGNLYAQAADGTGEPQRLLESDQPQFPLSFAPDGRLLFASVINGHGFDVFALSMDGSHHVEAVLNSAANEGPADISPDGRWIAYISDESGQPEMYVRPYPKTDSGGRWQISSSGGKEPLWSRDGREIYYRDFDGDMWAVPVTLQPEFTSGTPVKLFDNRGYRASGVMRTAHNYDLSRDGRFLMIKENFGPGPLSVVVVLNWFEELERQVPTGRQVAAR